YPPARNGTSSPAGSSRMSSLMNVATFSLDRTVHSHLLTEKTSCGTSIRMSLFTLTWQVSRTPSRASPRDTWLSSVGRSAPPPSSTVALHTPHVPLPPHADGMKMPQVASVPSSVPPAFTSRGFSVSPLTTIRTAPDDTSRPRATSSSPTSDSVMPANIPTLTATVVTITPRLAPSQLNTRERHEPDGHQARDDERDA